MMADIAKTYNFPMKNNEFSCLQWSILVKNGAIYCHLSRKFIDFAPKLLKYGAKLDPSWFKVAPSSPELEPK